LRFLYETTFTIFIESQLKNDPLATRSLHIKWKHIEKNRTQSMIFVSKEINADVCLIFLSEGDFADTEWKDFQEKLTLKTYESMNDLCDSQFAPYFKKDNNDEKNQDIKIMQKNEHVIVAGKQLFGNWTDEIISGIGEIVHIASDYQFIVNLPGKTGLSAGAIYKFNNEEKRIDLIGIVEGGTSPKIIQACSFVGLNSFFLKPYDNLPIEYIKYGYNLENNQYLGNYLDSSLRFAQINMSGLPFVTYTNVRGNYGDEEFEEPKIPIKLDDSQISGTEEW